MKRSAASTFLNLANTISVQLKNFTSATSYQLICIHQEKITLLEVLCQIIIVVKYRTALQQRHHLMVVDEVVADIHIRRLPHVLDVLSKATHLKFQFHNTSKNQGLTPTKQSKALEPLLKRFLKTGLAWLQI